MFKRAKNVTLLNEKKKLCFLQGKRAQINFIKVKYFAQ